MIFGFWEKWLVEFPSIHPLLLQFSLALVLIFTIARVFRAWQVDSNSNRHVFEWIALCWMTLLLTTAIGNPLAAGAICLGLETWRGKTFNSQDSLQAATTMWAIILGLLLAGGQYRVALVGTLVPCASIWVYAQITQRLPQAQHFLMQLTLDSPHAQKNNLIEEVQRLSDIPFRQIYQTENDREKTYALAFQTQKDTFEAFSKRLQMELPKEIRLDWQPVTLLPTIQGRPS